MEGRKRRRRWFAITYFIFLCYFLRKSSAPRKELLYYKTLATCTYLGGQLQHHHLFLSETDGDDFVGLAFTFLAAGFQTSGSTLCYALYELALHPDIQHRLRAEILQVLNKHIGELTYDGIQEMSYLDRVLSGEGIEAGYVKSGGYATRENLCLSLC
jgi:hypothetical protein